ncbi:potassium channel protein [Dongshaea marina]|uniref:potassium channel protein n=1 Tax=Dongshaea marina TaxID=2047966 RepID=UPI000D3ECD65|nr:potassium channel family protein [Dongshaea marina]
MTVWLLLKRWVRSRVYQLTTGRNLLLAVLLYALVIWLLLVSAGEQQLTQSIPGYLYWLVVTASTVGYGDLSPTTEIGRLLVALLVIPFGLGLFAACVGRIAAWVVHHWQRGLLGERTLKIKDHVIVVGWNGQRTLRLLRMLLREERNRRRIVLCVLKDIQNPLPDEIDFVKVESFTNADEMERAGIRDASCIILDNPEDDMTLSAALFCVSLNPQAHLLAHFKDEALSELLKQHCPNVESVPSVAVEMLAKAAIDPGSSALIHELLNTHTGMTQYSVQYPREQPATTLGALLMGFKEHYDATLIGLKNNGSMLVNPGLKEPILPGSLLFYIADERVVDIDWSKLNV